ncbi:hypothetical protein [Chryseobacterium lathyri]|uniref:hypothetical protein n=1 Tax=Chryseobacterium lathyri TaxID=395933 RepID=UPI001CBB4A9D|nr:hypothetical protein [Chryseobacterium lathyri]
MKTKLIILAVAGSVLLFSCTHERNDDETVKPTLESKVVKIEKLKITNTGEETAKVGDTILASPTDGAGLDPENNIDPSEGGDPKDVPPRK